MDFILAWNRMDFILVWVPSSILNCSHADVEESNIFETNQLVSEFHFKLFMSCILPGFLATGMDSPVISDSSHIDFPSTTLPSTGIFSPGTTFRRSPRCTNLTSMARSKITFPSLSVSSNVASVACSDISLARASDVFPLAMYSSHRPREMNTSNIGGVSKKVRGDNVSCIAMATMTTPTEYK